MCNFFVKMHALGQENNVCKEVFGFVCLFLFFFNVNILKFQRKSELLNSVKRSLELLN